MLRNGSSDETASTGTSIRKAAFAAGVSDGELRPANSAPDLRGSDHQNPDERGSDKRGPDLAGNATMASLIKDEMIPRLIAAHRTVGEPRKPSSVLQPENLGIALGPNLIADTALDSKPGALMDIVEQALASGLSRDSLLVDVLAPAARCLGSRWENDTADFIEVTMGLWRMQEVVHELSTCRPSVLARTIISQPEITDRRILFTVVPGDTHSFGSVVLEEMFEQAGWTTKSCRDGNLAELRAATRSHRFDIIALTISIDQPAAEIADLVLALRQSSRNPDVRIIVGGKVCNDHPGLADAVGADGTAADGRAAILMANTLVESRLVDHLATRATGRASRYQPPRAHAPGGSAHG